MAMPTKSPLRPAHIKGRQTLHFDRLAALLESTFEDDDDTEIYVPLLALGAASLARAEYIEEQIAAGAEGDALHRLLQLSLGEREHMAELLRLLGLNAPPPSESSDVMDRLEAYQARELGHKG